MSALCQKQTSALQNVMSALPLQADMCSAFIYVCFGPKADLIRLPSHLPTRYPYVSCVNRKRNGFMRADVVVAGVFLALISGSPAHAQVTIDASKVTCDQFVHAKVGAPRTVAAWLSGFYQGKRDNAVIDKE